MQTPPEAAELTEFRDPFVWAAPDAYRMLIGADYRDGSGVALLYRSQDLRSWTAMGPFCSARRSVVAGHDTGDVWECRSSWSAVGRHCSSCPPGGPTAVPRT